MKDSRSTDDLHATLSDIAYSRIRELIVGNNFPDNERLLEIDIAKKLGMSRTPVREALRRLISEGLLTHAPHRGVTVTSYDDVALSELYFVREEMEAMNVAQAARNASLVQLAQLEEILNEEREALSAQDVDNVVRLNDEFHDMICQATQNRFLIKLMAVVRDAVTVFRRSTLTDIERARLAHEEHKIIFEAIKNRDAEGAAAASRKHTKTNFAARLKQMRAKRSHS
ncbi:GntR family transcriptional regulator [Pusillimonas sp. ANT_WB101]|uniref:GntR family transcriptional regulator n=1 Tax=Pusillimonas sp. ANT_WB101 TaxID=2597356 RepID=UPI0011ED98CF|nr:GntR family transcriptional regulator [Pusillimonas sp. ANT_WB101]KAA0910465.1 GntR family transcriptional regulator [Pusillimonas sp. ANT_WB101]